jgi:ATP:cob(I)alamin adenosyltransferase
VEFAEENITRLEGWIDEYDEELPPRSPRSSYPAEVRPSVHLHQARTVCRRAERRVVPLVREGHCDQAVGRYLNRLSDFLYQVARYAAQREGHDELPYKKAT